MDRGTKSLLLAVDFNQQAAQLVAYAVRLCQNTGMRLRLLHVCQPLMEAYWPDVPIYEVGPLGELRASSNAEAMDQARERLRDLLPAQVSLDDVTIDVDLGVPEEIICREAATRGMAYVMLGTSKTDYRFVPRGLSVVLGVVANAPVPVLIVPEGAHPLPHDRGLRLLAADDLKDKFPAALRAASQLAIMYHRGELWHVHVNQAENNTLRRRLEDYLALGYHDAQTQEAVRQAMLSVKRRLEDLMRERAQGVRELLETAGVCYQCLLLEGEPSAEIDRLAETQAVDVVVYGRHRLMHGWFKIGKIPFTAMLSHHKPVMVVSPQEWHTDLSLGA